ncbi:sigma-70 family RNA polymerase sigma factor [Candidatus Poribacteria bacterium]|nr:sigma-70 family RNA polymerase sigma factor [Candidatus Poribacteria bacterium]
MELGEEELVRQAKDGDETAFGFLVDRYKGAVHALAYRKLGDYHEAEDVVQEVFIRAYQKLNTLREPGNFAGWLYVITVNCCRMHLRGRYRKRGRTIPLDQVSQKQWSSLSLRRHIDEERRKLVRDAVAGLPEGDRTVITLHYMGGMSCKEIARFMGTSVNLQPHRPS